jgi:hypothetical protein
MHLLDNIGGIRKLRRAGKTGRSPHRSANPAMSVQTRILANEPVEFTANIQASQRPLFAQAAWAKALLSALALTLKGF